MATSLSGNELASLDMCLERAVAAEVEGVPEAVARAEAEAQELLQGALRGLLLNFGTAEKIPKKEFTLQDLQNEGVEAARLLSPEDTTLDEIRKFLVAVTVIIGTVLIAVLRPAWFDLLRIVVAVFLALFVDALLSRGVLELVVVDSIARFTNQDYGKRVAQHEAGHFLVAYLVGILPKAYTLSSFDALVRYQSPSVQAGCIFCDDAFRKEVSAGKLSGQSLDRFVCVALAGVVVEYMRFGQARGGMTDIQQIDGLLQALGFEQRRASAQVRWSVLNTLRILKRHDNIHLKLSEAMSQGASVGQCISLIESMLPNA